VRPEEEPPERLPYLRLQWNEERQFHELPRREDGACVHLGPEGCTIYEHRPEVCRRHDCRVPAIWGLHLVYDEGQSAPWREFTDTGADRKVLEARQTAGKRLLVEQGRPDVVDVRGCPVMDCRDRGVLAEYLAHNGAAPGHQARRGRGLVRGHPTAAIRELAKQHTKGAINALSPPSLILASAWQATALLDRMGTSDAGDGTVRAGSSICSIGQAFHPDALRGYTSRGPSIDRRASMNCQDKNRVGHAGMHKPVSISVSLTERNMIFQDT
jgi:Putative zinc- or iron-chelating domain